MPSRCRMIRRWFPSRRCWEMAVNRIPSCRTGLTAFPLCEIKGCSPLPSPFDCWPAGTALWSKCAQADLNLSASLVSLVGPVLSWRWTRSTHQLPGHSIPQASAGKEQNTPENRTQTKFSAFPCGERSTGQGRLPNQIYKLFCRLWS